MLRDMPQHALRREDVLVINTFAFAFRVFLVFRLLHRYSFFYWILTGKARRPRKTRPGSHVSVAASQARCRAGKRRSRVLRAISASRRRSEEHTSELQSR